MRAYPAKDAFVDPLHVGSSVEGPKSEENDHSLVESLDTPQQSLNYPNEKLLGGMTGTWTSPAALEQEDDSPDRFAPERNVSTSSTLKSNITINSDLLYKNHHSNLEYRGNKTDESKVGLAASILQTTGLSVSDRTTDSNQMSHAKYAHIQTLHHTFKRRFQHRPSEPESKHINIHPEECKRKYLVTKLRSWRSGYCRILSFHTSYFTTVDPESREITNLWYYHQVVNYIALPNEPDCMLIEVIDNGQSIKLKLKCQPGERDEALTDFVQLKYLSDTHVHSDVTHRGRYKLFDRCFRQKRNGSKAPIGLLCAPHGIIQMDVDSGSVMRTILYRCIISISFLSDDQNGIVLHMNETNPKLEVLNQKIFYVPYAAAGSGRSAFLTALKNHFELLSLKWNIVESATLEKIQSVKTLNDLESTFGECMISYAVKRISERKPEGSNRYLLLTCKGFLLEIRHDIKNESSLLTMCTSHQSLQSITNVVRHSSLFPPPLNYSSVSVDSCFTVEYQSGLHRTYSSENRDVIIVALLDVAIYICRNFNVTATHVLLHSYRISSSVQMPEDSSQNNINLFQSDPCEIEFLRLLHEVATVTDSYLKLLRAEDAIEPKRYVDEFYSLVEMCIEFNANVPIEAVPLLPDDRKLITETVCVLWVLTTIILDTLQKNDNDFISRSLESQLCSVFQTQYRLLICPSGYMACIENPIPESIFDNIGTFQDNFVQYWFLKSLSALILPLPFSTARDIEKESRHKLRILDPRSGVSEYLVRKMLDENIVQIDPLLAMVSSNILESVLCSHKDSTPSEIFGSVINMISLKHISLLHLLDSSSCVVVENVTLILRVIATHDPSNSAQIRELALTSGISLRHFYLALFGLDEGQRNLSKYLCSLWMSGSSFCDEKQLLKRMLPPGFLAYLDMPGLSSKEERELDILDGVQNSHLNRICSDYTFTRSGVNKNRFRAKVLTVENSFIDRKEDHAQENFRIFFHMLKQDHNLPDLIWNRSTLLDLKGGIERALEEIGKETAKSGGLEKIAWNHQQFSIPYKSLDDEIQVGSIFLRAWLQSGESFIKTLRSPVRLFENLYRRIILDIDKDVEITNLCIKSIERLYAVHSKAIGVFPDVPNILRYICVTNFEVTRDCLLSLMKVIIGVDCNPNDQSAHLVSNIEQLLNSQCIDMFSSMVKECNMVSTIKKPRESPHIALKCMIEIVCVHKSVNSRNIPFFPIPLAKRIICASHNNLAFICQVLLSDDEKLVDCAAELLRLLMEYNDEVCEHLYQYGIFYFILRYRGGNWLRLSQLLYETHMKQKSPELEVCSLEKSSILKTFLPIGLLNILTFQGPKKFANIFTSNCDTPEVIWNQDMRRYLASMINEHIGEFLTELQSNCSSTYTFSMMPVISYDRLENEIFCHYYYLSNLCSEGNAAEYPIASPKSLFLETFQHWNTMLIPYKTESNDLCPNDGESILCSPPEKLHRALLIMKTQLVICKRYPTCIEHLKYPAYHILLRYLVVPNNNSICSHMVLKDQLLYLRTAMELLFYTCLVSPMNVESLVTQGGVLLLIDLLNCCIEHSKKILNDSESRSDDIKLLMETLTFVVKTISGVAYFANGREAIECLPDCLKFCYNWCSCIHSGFANSIYGHNLLRRYALEGLASLTKSEIIQHRLTECGILWNLLRVMLDFDENIHVSSIPDEVFQISISSMEINYHCALATRGLGMLCGVLNGELVTPNNPKLFDTVKHLLTPPIAKLLRNSETESILLTLNLTMKTPLRLWDANMRLELKEMVVLMEAKQMECPNFLDDLKEAREFHYSNMNDEINIGGVYIRLFNAIDDSQIAKQIPDCFSFARSIIQFIGRSLLHDGIGDEIINRDYVFEYDKFENDRNFCSVGDDGFYMAVLSLARLLKLDGIFDQILCNQGSPAVIISCLALRYDSPAWLVMTDILVQLSQNISFATYVANDFCILQWLFSKLEHPTTLLVTESKEQNLHSKLWIIMDNFASTPPIVSYMINSSCWFELLAIVTQNSRFEFDLVSREGAAQTLARLLFDSNSSAIMGALLRRFMPSAFVTDLQENGPASMLQLYDKNSDTPELIWDDTMRSDLDISISLLLDTFMDQNGSRIRDQLSFSLPSDYAVEFSRLHEEYFLAGIYLNNFLKNPTVPLRDPIGFLEGLFSKFSKDMEQLTTVGLHQNTNAEIATEKKDTSHDLSLIVKCIEELCSSRPFLYSKFSSWLYNKQLIHFLYKCIASDILGEPLRCTVRLLFVSSHSIDNIEDIAMITDADGRYGIVDGMMQAINGKPLHRESSLMIQCLAEIFRMALGDVEQFERMNSASELSKLDSEYNSVALAPSPAPTGTHPVRKLKKISIGDDPLAQLNQELLIQDNRSVPSQNSSKFTRTVGVARSVNCNRQHEKISMAFPHEIDVSTLQTTSTKQENSHTQSTYEKDNTRHPMISETAPSNHVSESSLSLSNISLVPKSTQLHSTIDCETEKSVFTRNAERDIEPSMTAFSGYETEYKSMGALNYSSTYSSVAISDQTQLDSDSEYLRKSFMGANGCAKGRPTLLNAAFKCRLPVFLVIDVLDNKDIKNVIDPNGTLSFASSLLKLLLKDPGYGRTFDLMLNECPTWKAVHMKI